MHRVILKYLINNYLKSFFKVFLFFYSFGIILNLFEEKYNTNQAKYTHTAYNIIMHFCSDFSLFQFQNITGGGKVNTYSPLHHYIDYELVPLE